MTRYDSRAKNLIRLGGDEYTVLAVDASKDPVVSIQARLLENIRKQNLENPVHPLSVSVGAARYDPRCPSSLEILLEQADQALYIVKRAKKDIAG